MNGNSISLGRMFGIPIKVSTTLLFMLPVLALMYCRSNFMLGLIIVVGIFVSVALHELGHSLVAMRFGCHVQEIELGLLGGAAKMSYLPDHPKHEILIALAGPAVSLVIGLLGILSTSELIAMVGAINLFLCGFNLLPCFPMDGGRVLRAALAAKKKNRLEATRIAVKIGKYFCIFFVIFGLLNQAFMLALIGGYIYFAGQQEYRMIMMQNQVNRSSGFREGQIDVEVSPPPYATSETTSAESWMDKLKSLFR